jgi:ribosomal protection tetracycline resistance protein
VRQDDARQEISVSLYGEVQREVIEATLADEYGLEVSFHETTTICIERPRGAGEAIEFLNTPSNPFHADLGLRVEPAPAGSGVEVLVEPGLDPRDAPLYTFKTFAAFVEHMGEYVRLALAEGLYGWQVTDCVVTLTECGYSVADGPPSRRGPTSTSYDYRKLTPIVLHQALRRARTMVCEPVLTVVLEVPTNTTAAIQRVITKWGAEMLAQTSNGDLTRLEARLVATHLHQLQRQLPDLTGGEGVLEQQFHGYQPVRGRPPLRSGTF